MKSHNKQEGMWWRWTESCDKCGRVLRDYNVHSTNKPNTDEADFCINCFKYFLDNNISYESIKEQYKKEIFK